MSKINRREMLAGAAGLSAIGASNALGASGALALHDEEERPIGAWTRMADMPFPVQEIYPTAHRQLLASNTSHKPAVKSLLVNAGGLTDAPGFAHNVTDNVTIYDMDTDQWRFGPPLPAPMHHVALASNSGSVFAIGGFLRDNRGGWRMQNSIWRLDDLEGDEWYEARPLPIPQAETVAVSLNGRVHVAGGRSPAGSANRNWNDHIDTDKHWAYIASQDFWAPMRPLPTPRNSAAGAVYRGAFYVIGGRTVAGGNLSRVDVYDPVSDRWQVAAPLPKSLRADAPVGQGGLAAAAWNGYLYAFGGEWFGAGGSGVYAEVWEYDPREDKWRGVAAMPRPRHGLGAVALRDGVYVLGGASNPGGNGVSAVLDRFTI